MILLPLLQKMFSKPSRVEEQLNRMEIHMSRITQTLIAINDQLNRASEEIISKIAELQTRDYLTDEDMAILSRIKAGAQTLDDIVPDEVVEEAETEEKNEVEEAPEDAPEAPEDDSENLTESPEESEDDTPEEEDSKA